MPYVGSVPQSGCTFTEPTQLLMIEFEFGSTAAEEISVFHRLLLANGTKPLRLAVCPDDITLQARLLLPVPPLFPPEPPDPLLLFVVFETPEQANRPANRASAMTERAVFVAEQGQRIVPLFSRRGRTWLKRPLGHVRFRVTSPDGCLSS